MAMLVPGRKVARYVWACWCNTFERSPDWMATTLALARISASLVARRSAAARMILALRGLTSCGSFFSWSKANQK